MLALHQSNKTKYIAILFCTEMENWFGSQQKWVLEEAAGEGLVPAVGERLVQLVHEDELLCEEHQFEGAAARLEGGGARQNTIIELRLLLLLRL